MEGFYGHYITEKLKFVHDKDYKNNKKALSFKKRLGNGVLDFLSVDPIGTRSKNHLEYIKKEKEDKEYREKHEEAFKQQSDLIEKNMSKCEAWLNKNSKYKADVMKEYNKYKKDPEWADSNDLSFCFLNIKIEMMDSDWSYSEYAIDCQGTEFDRDIHAYCAVKYIKEFYSKISGFDSRIKFDSEHNLVAFLFWKEDKS